MKKEMPSLHSKLVAEDVGRISMIAMRAIRDEVAKISDNKEDQLVYATLISEFMNKTINQILDEEKKKAISNET